MDTREREALKGGLEEIREVYGPEFLWMVADEVERTPIQAVLLALFGPKDEPLSDRLADRLAVLRGVVAAHAETKSILDLINEVAPAEEEEEEEEAGGTETKDDIFD